MTSGMAAAVVSTDAGLRLERDGAVLVLLIDRPERRNAIDRPTALAIARALDLLDADDSLSAAVLAGAGEIFSAGMDLKAFSATGERPIDEVRGGFGIVEQLPVRSTADAREGAAAFVDKRAPRWTGR